MSSPDRLTAMTRTDYARCLTLLDLEIDRLAAFTDDDAGDRLVDLEDTRMRVKADLEATT